MRRITNISSLLLAILLLATSAFAQSGGSTILGIVDVNGVPVKAGDAANDAIRVLCVASSCSGGGGGSTGGISLADESAFTANTTEFNPIGGVYNDGLSDVSSGDAAAARITPDRGLHVNLRTVTGTEVGTAGAPLRVDPTGATIQPVSGTVTVSGSVTVSGTVTANQGGSPWSMRLQDGAGATLATITAGNALKVDPSGVTQPVSGTFWQATQPVSLASVPTHAVTQSGTWNVGTVTTLPSIPAGSNLIGQVSPVATATTTNATSTCYLSSAGTTNSTNCKSSAGNIYAIRAINTTATLYYLRLYNASAAPTCSSATNFVETLPVPASTTGAGVILSVPVGIAYGTGIGFCLTGGGSSTDNTNAATGVYLSIYYK